MVAVAIVVVTVRNQINMALTEGSPIADEVIIKFGQVCSGRCVGAGFDGGC